LRVIEFDKFAEVAREVGAVFLVDMAHVSGLVAAKLHQIPCRCGFRFLDHTQDPARAAERSALARNRGSKAELAVFLGIQGGRSMHKCRRKAVAFAEAVQPSFRDYIAQVIGQRQGLAEELARAVSASSPAARTTTMILVDVASRGVTGKAASRPSMRPASRSTKT